MGNRTVKTSRMNLILMASLVCAFLSLTACSSNNPTTSSTTVSGTAGDYSSTTTSSKVDTSPNTVNDSNLTNLSLEEEIGYYGPNNTPITLTGMVEHLGIEIDSSKNQTAYVAKDESGVMREFVLQPGEDVHDFLDVIGPSRSYHVNQYGFDGDLLASVNYQMAESLDEIMYINVYNRDSEGNAVACFYFYPDYETEYILHYYTWYHNGNIISRTNIDATSHKRSSISVYSPGFSQPVKEYYCDFDGNIKSYTTYVYEAGNINPIKLSYYDLDGNLQSYTIREYNEDGFTAKAYDYDAADNLLSCSEYIYENGSVVDVKTTKMDGQN